MSKQQLDGNKKVISDLVIDPMAIKAGLMAEYAKYIGNPLTHLPELAKILAMPGIVVSVPAAWGKFDVSDVNAWQDLPWGVFVRVLNDFAYAAANFTET